MRVFYINTVERLDNAPASIMAHLAAGVRRGGGSTAIFSRKGANVLWHYAMSRLADGEGLHSSGRTRALVKSIREFRPDIIHLHNIHGHYIDYRELFRFLAAYGRPVVWTLHDCWAFTGRCANYTAACGRWREGCGACPVLRQYPRSYIDLSARNYRLKRSMFLSVPGLHLVTPSAWLAGQVSESFLGRLPLTVISNGVDTDTFRPGAKVNDGRLKMIAVAQPWTPEKGREELQAIRRLLSPGESLEFISGVTDRREMARIYSSADILLAASRQESFGMTPVEAMACGTPAIVNNATALPELVSGATGRVTDFSDAPSALRAIRELRGCLGPAMSAECRMRTEKNYSAELMTRRYMELYGRLLG